MRKEQFLKDLLEKMEDKGIALENLSFDGDYILIVNDVVVEFAYNGNHAVISNGEISKRIGFIEELAQEVVALLPEEEWEAGQLVRKLCATRVLVSSPFWKFNLLDDDTYDLEYQYSYTTSELKKKGWERV